MGGKSVSEIRAQFKLGEPNPALSSENAFSLDVNLTLPGTGITAIIGPSGSGKTTLLRCIAGLIKSPVGKLQVAGEKWQQDSFFLPTHKRDLGYVFQDAALFSHLSVSGNLQFALKRSSHKPAKTDYHHILSVLGIEGLLNQTPDRLSGGERQRVAIARALLAQPRLLLMDEPLAALDMARKQEILPVLERIRKEVNTPVLYVSHAMDEVARLADYVVALDQGRVLAEGGLSDVFSRIDHPVPLGEEMGVILEARVIHRDPQWHLSRVAFAGGEIWVRDGGDEVGQAVRIRILARDVSLASDCHDDSSILNKLPVSIDAIEPDRDEAMSLVRLKSVAVDDKDDAFLANRTPEFMIARLTRRSVEYLDLTCGKTLWAQIKSVAIVR